MIILVNYFYLVVNFFSLNGYEFGDHVVLVGLDGVPGALVILHPGQVTRLVHFDLEGVDRVLLGQPVLLGDQIGLHGVQGEDKAAVNVDPF